MPISRAEAQALTELLCVIRPTWNARGVLTAGLGPLAKHPAPLEVIAWAAIRAAVDTQHVHTPAAIPLNGPHWNLADRPVTPRLTPDLECRLHVGQWADNCGPCNADRKGAPDQLEDEHGPIPADLTPMEAAKQAARAAKARQHAAPETDDPDAGAHPCPSCQRDMRRDVAAPDCTQPDAHPAPGSPPHHYGHPDHTAEHYRRHPWRRGMPAEARRQDAQRTAGRCLNLEWAPCTDGRAHLTGICMQPAGHHDAHQADGFDGRIWQRTHDAPTADWCDHVPPSPAPMTDSESGVTP